ncbi:MAG: hypothetical protein M3220_18620 [Chloroflexota bacterium]|nr:hypothetical protein [Chloroflexota bacterium]
MRHEPSKRLLFASLVGTILLVGLVLQVGAQQDGMNVRINFQPESSEIPAGYLADVGAEYGERDNGYTYGWNEDNRENARDRDSSNAPDQRYDTFNHLQLEGTYTWEIAVPNGEYIVTVVMGDPEYDDQVNSIYIEDTLRDDPDGDDHFDEYDDIPVSVTDGRLTIHPAPGADNAKIAFVEIVAKVTKRQPLYLPAIMSPLAIRNGGFETGDLTGWVIHGVSPGFQVNVVELGNGFAAQLGNPVAECAGGAPYNGAVGFYQRVQVPDTPNPTLSFAYLVHSQDINLFETFNVYIRDEAGELLEHVLSIGNPGNATMCGAPAWESGWQVKVHPLTAHRDQIVQLYFELRSIDDTAFFNTWAYLDDVMITDRP